MLNGYKVEWTNRAINDFNSIVAYLSNNWNERTVVDFVREIRSRDISNTGFSVCFSCYGL